MRPKTLPRNLMMMALTLFCASLCSSGCATAVSGGWGGAAGPARPPASMGNACDPMAVMGVPSTTQGMTAEQQPMGPATCGSRWRCDSAAGCTYVVTSPATPPNTLLALVCDLRGPNTLGPSAAGGGVPYAHAQIKVGPGGWYGTQDAASTKPLALAGHHWLRAFEQQYVQTSPLTATAEIQVPQGSQIGQCGWRRY